jgi:hypothetical protein
MPFDFVFPMPPAIMTPVPVAPGTALAPAQGVDTSTNVGYVSSGKGWVPQVPATTASVNLTAQAANIGATTLYAVPAHLGGMYTITVFEESTNTPTTATLPSVSLAWTDNDTGNSIAATQIVASTGSVSAANVLAQTTYNLDAKGGTTITYQTGSYAAGSGTALQYSLHIRVNYMG